MREGSGERHASSASREPSQCQLKEANDGTCRRPEDLARGRDSLVARHNEEALQIAYDEARVRAARHDDESYREWLKVAHVAGILLG